MWNKSTLSIVLDGPEKTYTNSDTVTGTIYYNVIDKVDLTSITVELLGVAKSLNARVDAQQGLITRSECHELLSQKTSLFPPSEIKKVSKKNGLYTISEGTHAYPFTLRFPDKDHIIKCLDTGSKFTHGSGFIKEDYCLRHLGLPPSSMYVSDGQTYAIVSYSILAKASKPSLLKFNTRKELTLQFNSLPEVTNFSLRQISMNRNTLLPDYDYEILRQNFRFIDIASKNKRKSLWKKLTPSFNKVQIPFALCTEFRPVASYQTEIGPSNRIIRGGASLSDFLSISLVTPFSPQDIAEIIRGPYLGLDNKKTDVETAHENLLIKNIEIRLISMLSFKGEHTQDTYETLKIFDTPMDHQIELTDFEKSTQHGKFCFAKYLKKFPAAAEANNSANAGYYEFQLFPQWFNCTIPCGLQSFLCCNIRKNYFLRIAVTLATTADPLKHSTVKCQSPIVLIDKLNMSQVPADAPLYEEAEEQLPAYTPAKT